MRSEIDLGPLETLREQCGVREQQHLPGEILRARALRLALRGLNATRAAAVLGCHPTTARKIYADPAFQKQVRLRVDSVFTDIDASFKTAEDTLHERIQSKARAAFEVLAGMLDDPGTHPGYRMRIAQDLLDRNEETQAGRTLTTRRLDPEQLHVAAATAREMDNVIPLRKKA